MYPPLDQCGDELLDGSSGSGMTQDNQVSAAHQVSSSGSDLHGDGALFLAAPYGFIFFGSGGFLHAPGVVANGSQDGQTQSNVILEKGAWVPQREGVFTP